MKEGITGTEKEASEDISNLLALQRQKERELNSLLESDSNLKIEVLK